MKQLGAWDQLWPGRPLHGFTIAARRAAPLSNHACLFPPVPARPAEATATQLEAIARLAWSDEAARQELGQRRGIESIAAGMRQVGSLRVQFLSWGCCVILCRCKLHLGHLAPSPNPPTSRSSLLPTRAAAACGQRGGAVQRMPGADGSGARGGAGLGRQPAAHGRCRSGRGHCCRLVGLVMLWDTEARERVQWGVSAAVLGGACRGSSKRSGMPHPPCTGSRLPPGGRMAGHGAWANPCCMPPGPSLQAWWSTCRPRWSSCLRCCA